MQINVTATKVTISTYDNINSGEYNIHQCEFSFSNEYDGLVKVAVFAADRPYKITIIDNVCEIPNEVLQKENTVILGVYAYQNIGDKLELRYSPTPTTFFVDTGSYKENATLVIPPAHEENIEADLYALLDEIQEKLDSGELNGEDGFSPIITETPIINGYNIEITDAQGTTSFNLYNGEQGPEGQPGKDGKDGQDGAPGPAGADGKDGKDGKDGQNGQNGQDGYTPVRGTDYWTDSDIAAMEQYCANYIDANINQAIGGSY